MMPADLEPIVSRMVSRMRQLVLVLGTLLCSACTTLPQPEFGVAAPPEFALQARIAVRHGDEGGSARIDWRHAPSSDDLLVTSSLGQGIARITRRGNDVRLVTADNTEYRAQDAEGLTEQVLGWRLPLAGLSSWVRGRPASGSKAVLVRDAQGQLQRLEQDDWRIEYLDWKGNLPSRINLQHDSGTERPIAIRLLVDSWEAP